mmetsp:Transcript_18347/g.52517  ORF Transcript_18347/g.52517 Transcript_18347/m.52517 type:complete len:221 (-) Transcript_18347:243-905(-)
MMLPMASSSNRHRWPAHRTTSRIFAVPLAVAQVASRPSMRSSRLRLYNLPPPPCSPTDRHQDATSYIWPTPVASSSFTTPRLPSIMPLGSGEPDRASPSRGSSTVRTRAVSSSSRVSPVATPTSANFSAAGANSSRLPPPSTVLRASSQTSAASRSSSTLTARMVPVTTSMSITRRSTCANSMPSLAFPRTTISSRVFMPSMSIDSSTLPILPARLFRCR